MIEFIITAGVVLAAIVAGVVGLAFILIIASWMASGSH